MFRLSSFVRMMSTRSSGTHPENLLKVPLDQIKRNDTMVMLNALKEKLAKETDPAKKQEMARIIAALEKQLK